MIYLVLVGGLCLAAGAAVALLVGIQGHERREFRRQDEREKRAEDRDREARQRHELLIRELRDQRALTLGAISQRTNIERDLQDVKECLTDHAEMLDTPERRARRPK